jgi:hypothetical protein
MRENLRCFTSRIRPWCQAHSTHSSSLKCRSLRRGPNPAVSTANTRVSTNSSSTPYDENLDVASAISIFMPVTSYFVVELPGIEPAVAAHRSKLRGQCPD